jgi:hypothetical protein
MADSLHKMNSVKRFLEKPGGSPRPPFQLLPPFAILLAIQEICETGNSVGNVDVVSTRNPVIRFAANYIADGLADAVLAQNSDYLLFDQIHSIPIDSVIFRDDPPIVTCEMFTSKLASDVLMLANPLKLFDLSVLLGVDQTESFVLNRHDIASLLGIRLTRNHAEFLVAGIVE